jgi:hypothetical protein
MAKPTYTAIFKDGSTKAVAYTPLIVIAGTQTHRLALHKNDSEVWIVADPRTGALVVGAVSGQYRGIRISSRGLSLAEVRQLAIADVEAIISRLGSDRFNAVLNNGIMKG